MAGEFLSGGAMLIQQLRGVKRKYESKFGGALIAASKKIMARSAEIVPTDTGLLAGKVEPDKGPYLEIVGWGFKTIVSFGYRGVPYAWSVHEDPRKRHGEIFNEYYAHEIKIGLTHSRRPQEQYQFLARPVYESVHDRSLIRVIYAGLR